ncbi:hypothetical protein B0H12DRAFT_232402 [Mycena haematopus]|nr:hypothetical protein B0H12DRAFT_232402 [Mycena haematopus]
MDCPLAWSVSCACDVGLAAGILEARLHKSQVLLHSTAAAPRVKSVIASLSFAMRYAIGLRCLNNADPLHGRRLLSHKIGFRLGHLPSRARASPTRIPPLYFLLKLSARTNTCRTIPHCGLSCPSPSVRSAPCEPSSTFGDGMGRTRRGRTPWSLAYNLAYKGDAPHSCCRSYAPTNTPREAFAAPRPARSDDT